MYGITAKNISRLQTIQKRAARLILKANRTDNASLLVRKLYWLPVHQRIRFKTLTLAYKSHIERALVYLSSKLLKCKTYRWSVSSFPHRQQLSDSWKSSYIIWRRNFLKFCAYSVEHSPLNTSPLSKYWTF